MNSPQQRTVIDKGPGGAGGALCIVTMHTSVKRGGGGGSDRSIDQRGERGNGAGGRGPWAVTPEHNHKLEGRV